MNLEQLQTSLSTLIKSRNGQPPEDPYLKQVAASPNLLLVKKIALWWRSVQVEQFCVLTTGLLRHYGHFEEYLEAFIREKDFSAFREEIGFQFLAFIAARDPHSLVHSVAQFEEAIIKKRLGHAVDTRIPWSYEPYAVISGLLRNTFSAQCLLEGHYETFVSVQDKNELFTVLEVASPESQ